MATSAALMRPTCEGPFFAGDPRLDTLTKARGCYNTSRFAMYWRGEALDDPEPAAVMCGIHRKTLARRLGGDITRLIRIEAIVD